MKPTIAIIGAFITLLPAALFGQELRTFESAEAAATAAISAAEQNNAAELNAIFGTGARAVLTSGDPKQDQSERAEFARLGRGKHKIEPDPMNPKRAILSIGSQDWPFPIPIVNRDGKWSFDASEGAVELRARRVGSNELDTISILAGYVEAQKEYAAQDRDNDGLLEYAQRLVSSAGKHDGLYWEGSPEPLVPKEFAYAEQGPHATPYHGYYFRVLKAQGPNAQGGRHNFLVKECMVGGYALVATPAQYRVTGVHSFIVNQDGVIYEKDMKRLPPVTTYDPDKSWTRVD